MNKNLIDELNKSLESSDLIWWEWYIPDNKVTFNPLKVKTLGYDPKNYAGSKYQAFTALIHKEDYERAMQAMRDHLEGKADIYRIDYRIKAKDGHYEWYMDRGSIIERTPNGRPVKLRGLVIDLGKEISVDIQEENVLKMIRNTLPMCADDKCLVVCANCISLKISDNKWVKTKKTLGKAVDARISHSVCPDCAKLLYPEFVD
jgi:PAS domain S-box-containing protein